MIFLECISFQIMDILVLYLKFQESHTFNFNFFNWKTYIFPFSRTSGFLSIAFTPFVALFWAETNLMCHGGEKRIWVGLIKSDQEPLHACNLPSPQIFFNTQKRLRIPGFMGKKVPWLPWCLGNPFFFLDWIISRSVDPSNFRTFFWKPPGCLLKPPNWRLETQRESILGVCWKNPLPFASWITHFRPAGFVLLLFWCGKNPTYIENTQIRFHASKSRWIEPMKTNHLESFHFIVGGFFKESFEIISFDTKFFDDTTKG